MNTRAQPIVRWSLPAFTLEAWFVARRVPAQHRPGFRAWLEGEGISGGFRLNEWDEHFGRFQSAAT